MLLPGAVVIYRLPLMLKEHWNHEMKLRSTETQTLLEEKRNINLIYPRSFCPHCFRTIRIRDNILLLSYLCLNGRASCCGQQIPYHYLLVEVMSSLLFILAALLYSPGGGAPIKLSSML
ncbi:prepilin peptidase [Escherichia coli]